MRKRTYASRANGPTPRATAAPGSAVGASLAIAIALFGLFGGVLLLRAAHRLDAANPGG